MSRKRRIDAILIITGLLMLIWVIDYGQSTFAQEHQHTHAPVSTKQLKNPLTATEQNIARGRTLFRQNCVPCHDIDGRARAQIASAMKVKPADLTMLHGLTDGEIYWVITHGIKASEMPSFKTNLSDEERWQTTIYVKHLMGEHPHTVAKETHKHQPKKPETTRSRQDVTQQHQHADQPASEQKQGQTSPSDHQQHQTLPADQQHKGMTQDHQQQGHESKQMDHGQMDHDQMSSVTGGPYRSHMAIGSGTSLIPSSSPGYMWHFRPNNWTVMLHGELKTGFNYQSGPRGVGKAESQNYLMVMASRKLAGGEFMLRGMFSAEPLTIPHGGSPQLFQVGETYRGQPIVDAQHPHDLFMELAASYTYPISEQVAVQFYGGPVAEPALGPTAFMHRASASENPASPLGHHWQDSTHISHGVFTTAITAWRFKIEGSVFNGREPDEDRVALDFGPMDSWSTRLWFTPTRNWAMQFSHGHLIEPEAHEPINISRTTASISYNRQWSDGNWASSLIWGRNSTIHGDSNTYLFESTVNFIKKNYFYTRLELADREGLLQENIFGKPSLEPNRLFPALSGLNGETEFEPQFRIAAFTFGGVRDVISTSKLLVGIGADLTFYHQPGALKTVYGNNPIGAHFFIRLRPGKMQH
jgi:mono/diheme cytochrome c family protein